MTNISNTATKVIKTTIEEIAHLPISALEISSIIAGLGLETISKPFQMATPALMKGNSLLGISIGAVAYTTYGIGKVLYDTGASNLYGWMYRGTFKDRFKEKFIDAKNRAQKLYPNLGSFCSRDEHPLFKNFAAKLKLGSIKESDPKVIKAGHNVYAAASYSQMIPNSDPWIQFGKAFTASLSLPPAAKIELYNKLTEEYSKTISDYIQSPEFAKCMDKPKNLWGKFQKYFKNRNALKEANKTEKIVSSRASTTNKILGSINTQTTKEELVGISGALKSLNSKPQTEINPEIQTQTSYLQNPAAKIITALKQQVTKDYSGVSKAFKSIAPNKIKVAPERER